MKMFRHLIVAAIAAVATLGSSGFVSNSTAEAHSVRYYYVYYRSCPCSPWAYYGAYDCPTNAQYAAAYIQSMGYETYIY